MADMLKYGMKIWMTAIIVCCATALQAQGGDDIWREVDLDEFNYEQSPYYCQRLFGYYRYFDDGVMYIKDLEYKLYRVYEGIFELDIRYGKEWDDDAEVMVGRNLVHPEKEGKFMDFYGLKPYTFLEKARKRPKVFTLETSGDTTRVYAKQRQAGIIVKDTLLHELRMKYDALAPDTSVSVNLLFIKGRLSNIQADATYWYDESSEDYVPQGNLRRITFDGNFDINIGNSHEVFNEFTEIYVDSVAYFTREQYKAERKVSVAERRSKGGYTDADIERLKQKLDVPPLTEQQIERIEQQRDWDDQYELWAETYKN